MKTSTPGWPAMSLPISIHSHGPQTIVSRPVHQPLFIATPWLILTLAFPLEWSHFYVQGPEIRKHIQNVAKEYDLEKKIKFNSKVLAATWLEDEGKWLVKVDLNGVVTEDKADAIINASGVLK